MQNMFNKQNQVGPRV